MKITHKLFLGFAAVALLIGIVGYVSVNRSRAALQKAIGEASVVLAAGILDDIDRTIYHRIERWKSYVATNPRLNQTLISSNQEFKGLDDLQGYIKQRDREWISAPKGENTPFMKEILNNRLSQRLKRRIDFYEKREGYRVFAEVFVTNKYGVNVAQSGRTSDYYQADEEWWQVAKRDGFYIRDVEYDESAGVYSTDIGIRIDEARGNFLGVMKAVLNIEGVFGIIRELEVKGAGIRHFKLFTKDGRLIYSPHKFEFFKDASEDLFSQFGRKEEPGHVNYFIGYEPEEEKEVLLAHAHSRGYKDYKGLGWILIIEQEAKEVFAPVARLRAGLLFISFVIIIWALLIGGFVSRSVSRSSDRLQKAYTQLRQTQDQLIQAEKLNAVGQLASGVAHEVKNPLAIMLQGLYRIEKKMPSEQKDIAETLTMLKNSVARADNIINSLLDFSRSSRLKLAPEDINNIIKESLDLVRARFKFENVQIVHKIKKDMPKVLVDKNRVEQVFINVLLNAIQAMPKGGTITVRCLDKTLNEIRRGIGRRQEDFFRPQERAVIVEFEDTGAGISEENLKKIFDPFFTTKAGRTGLGLSVSQNIVFMHKGLMYIKSQPNKGTRVTIILKTAV